ncbi:hypothetical protein XH86_05295 [Bradyrhizobium guangdongense]|uniref:Uncharacterized protein n=1 Tax=Bradyrhizobium guangdongense TaxID=1325090 RepID=A0ABX6UAK5_9BRAD|nr:hypothetical protein X265_05295 [Bradyrhizobium guangdongense]QOZ58222.1 hypothetical protein XH86_05295 [Bradyrhizobium guangdongense]
MNLVFDPGRGVESVYEAFAQCWPISIPPTICFLSQHFHPAARVGPIDAGPARSTFNHAINNSSV